MIVRCRLCGKDQPAEEVIVCQEAVRQLQAAERGARCPACRCDHRACVRFD